MIAFNGQYLPAASHGNMRITAACLGGQLVLGNWLMTATAQAIIAAFGAEEGIAVISRTNDYLNALALTDITRAQQLAMFINEDPLNGVGIGQFFTNAELQAVADAQLIAEKKLDDGSCWVRILHHHVKNGTQLYPNRDAAGYNVDSELFSILKYIANFYKDDKYEFLAEEYNIDGGEVSFVRRWSQTSNPFTSTSASGYVNISNGAGALYKYTGTETIIIIKSGWWGATGALSAYNGGIPGYNCSSINKGTLDLWIRIS